MKQFIREKIFKSLKQEFKFKEALEALAFDVEKIELNDVPVQMPGDLALNLSLKLAKYLKANPRQIALEIQKKLENDPEIKEFLEKIEIAGPGFLNLTLNKNLFLNELNKILTLKEGYGESGLGNGKKMMVEFVSANPTGPIHLGNGRGGPLGDTIANVLIKAGFRVWREYYVNDFGNQIKILGHSILKDNLAQYRGDYVDLLNEQLVRKNLQQKPDPFEIGRKGAKIIVEKSIQSTMKKMGIFFDEYFLESSLHEEGVDKVLEVINEFKKRDLIYEKEGALWFRATDFGDEKDRVVRKSSGEITYFGGDIAYHKNKFERGFEKVINIWGADHHGDVRRVMGAVEALGYGGKLQILLSQMVRVIKDGREFKMSKRTGNYVALEDLLDEVGKDTIRFFFLLHSADTHIDFDLNLAREKSNKNPVFYVQYAHARLCSILRKANEETWFKNSNFEEELSVDEFDLFENEKEQLLIKILIKLPDLIRTLAITLEVHQLSAYAMQLADSFHSFYQKCKVLDSENPAFSLARLKLIKAQKIVLAEVLRLMGVSAPEKM